MKKTQRATILAALTVLIALSAWAADVSGKWIAEVPGRDGQTRNTTFNFKAEGEKLTGTMTAFQNEVEIKDGTVKGDSISFKVNMQFGGNPAVLVYDGKISGDEIKFTRKREGSDRSQEFIAKRATS